MAKIEKKILEINDSIKLQLKIWEIDSPVWIVATHGLGEHSGRHQFLYDLFGGEFNLLLYDLRGHGESTGRRTYIESFEDYRTDLEQVLTYLREQFKMSKFCLFGHSMGGLITADLVQNSKDHLTGLDRVFLSSPVVKVPTALGKLLDKFPLTAVESLSSNLPSLGLPGLVDLKNLSHNPEVKTRYQNDPLCSLKVESRLGLNLISASKRVFSRPLRCDVPLTVSIGSGDEIVSPSACKSYFREIEKNANFNLVKEGRHELHNEIEEYSSVHLNLLKKFLFKSRYQEV